MTLKTPKTTGSSRGRGAIFAEGLGTFVLVLIGAGALCVDHTTHAPIGQLGVALAGGLTLSAMTFALNGVSGAYLNPAATLAGVLTTRLPIPIAFKYVVAQIFGAICAGTALRALFPDAVRSIHLGLPAIANGVTFGQAVTAEALVAFAWIITLGATSWRGARTSIAPVAVGLVYATCILVTGPLTGGCGNPARAFASAFASGTYTDHAVYWAGPAAGAFVAAAAFLALFWRSVRAARPPSVEELEAPEGSDANLEPARVPYRQALTLFREGRLEEAAHLFSQATESRPEWPEPYYYIGIIYRDLGDDANAEAFFDAAVHFRGQQRSRQTAGGSVE